MTIPVTAPPSGDVLEPDEPLVGRPAARLGSAGPRTRAHPRLGPSIGLGTR